MGGPGRKGKQHMGFICQVQEKLRYSNITTKELTTLSNIVVKRGHAEN